MQLAGLRELRQGLADPAWVERLSLLTSLEPLVVAIDSDQPCPDLARVPTVAVAIGAHPDFDVAVDDPAAVEPIAAAIAERPLTSLALVGLLRMEAGTDVWSGILAESATYSALLGGREFQRWLGARPAPPSADRKPAVSWERDDDTLIVTLDRPHVHNAFNRAMRDGLVEALQLVAVDTTIARVDLRGAGASFCSGGDLSEFGLVVDPPTAHAVRMTRHPAWWMHRLAGRVVPYLHGACIGAGIELPAFAARVVAAPDTRIGLPEVSMGLVPGAGGTVSIARRVGRQRCAWLALTGATIDAPTALGWGLIDEVA